MALTVTYDIITKYGRWSCPSLDGLMSYLKRALSRETELAAVSAFWDGQKVTREDIDLPDFVKEYNEKAQKG